LRDLGPSIELLFISAAARLMDCLQVRCEQFYDSPLIVEGESIDFLLKPNQFTTVTVVFVSWGKVVRLLVWPPGIPGEVSKDSVSAAASTAAK